MTSIVRRFVAIFVSFCALVPTAAAALEPPQPSAAAYVLMDADSGRVLLEKAALERRSIASTTKIMTAYTALSAARPEGKFKVARQHLKEGSSMYLQDGEVISFEALLYGLLLPSGNDAAECVADFCGTGRETFVARMNKTANSLGMTNTSFTNPSGLDEEGHYSCARDMAVLGCAALKDPQFLLLASTRRAQIGARSLENHNKLLGTLDGCIGLKTGFTSLAGRTLVSACERDGMRFVAVTLHDRADWDDHTALYDYAFSAYERREALQRGEVVALLPVRGSDVLSMKVAAAECVAFAAAAGEREEISYELPEVLTAPLKTGDVIGEAIVSLAGSEIARVPLVCAADAAVIEQENTGFLDKIFQFFA